MDATKPKDLLILDMNGLVCYKEKPPYNNSELPQDFLERNSYRVYKRPGADMFLRYCLKKYNVAIWSSTTQYNVKPILNWIFKPKQLRKLAFIWYRNQTKLDPDYGKSEYPSITEYDTVKNLADVWSNPYFNRLRKYGKTNTLIVDDSSNKVRFNPKNNVLVVESYKGFSNTINNKKCEDIMEYEDIKEYEDDMGCDTDNLEINDYWIFELIMKINDKFKNMNPLTLTNMLDNLTL